jgi:hypothetical protein
MGTVNLSLLLPGQPGGWLLSFESPKESNPRKSDPGLPHLPAAKQAGVPLKSANVGAAELAR